MEYVPWHKLFTYDALITCVLSPRGYGKTYGLRKQCVQDYLKRNEKFVVVTRYKNRLQGANALHHGFFDKLQKNNEFPGYEFKTDSARAYMRKITTNEKTKKYKWEQIGYFVALTGMQNTKEQTFTNVHRIIFDEFIIDKKTNSRYLPYEYELLINIYDSCDRRENKARMYLLGNTLDLINPYFTRWKINKPPKQNRARWADNKNVLLYNFAPINNFNIAENSTVGKLLQSSEKEKTAILGGKFIDVKNDFIEKKPKSARYIATFNFQNKTLSAWINELTGIFYWTKNKPKKPKEYALSAADMSLNIYQINKSEKALKYLFAFYGKGLARFDEYITEQHYLDIMKLLGIY